ncbi:hypothetical protein D9757_006721 [Collybiopsis confluens]|uniref:Mannitol-1-phosphate 5-dehydrogenase n=1 Tax=Collybiopsis confluens TaxID=2823264 RepID=A0A8H5M983_9AGAR|nr:hypothetical protein D9757_006721 [Collybiopsis confluens]
MSAIKFPSSSSSSSAIALHFGGGNIGRGLIGPVLSRAGFHLVFADVAEDLVNRLNTQGQYDIHILSNDELQLETVKPVSAVLSTDMKAIEQIAKGPLSIITTAVGPNVLPKLAKPLAQIIRTRMEAKMGPINVVACENLQHATDILRDSIMKELSEEKERLYTQDHIGFAVCSVDRIALPITSENHLDVGVEPFFEWTVDSKSLKKTDPDVIIDGMHDNLDAYVQRKLFTVNTGHAITAYLGFLHKKDTIIESITDNNIRLIVSEALQESGTALIETYRPFFTSEQHSEFIQKILNRFSNRHIHDQVSRVGREPLRKLRRGERLLGPVEMCKEKNLKRDSLLSGFAAALLFHPTHVSDDEHEQNEDQEATELQERISRDGVQRVVGELTGWSGDDEDLRKVVRKYDEFKESLVVSNTR